MSLVQLYVPTEVAREVVYAIGQLNLVQFRDLNAKVNEFQRSFVQELRLLENIERQYRFFKAQLDKRLIACPPYPYELDLAKACAQSELDELRESSALLESRVLQLIDLNESLYQREHDLKLKRYTIEGLGRFLALQGTLAELEGAEGAFSAAGSFVAGVINRDKTFPLQQILWRILRGNLYYHTEEIAEKIYDTHTNEFVDKNFFVIFSHGSLIFERIRKVCELLDALLYDVDLSEGRRAAALAEVDRKLTDLVLVRGETENALTTELVAVLRDLARWWEIVARERAVYRTMNRCDYDAARKTLVAEGWVPTDEIDHLLQTVRQSLQPVIINVLQTLRTPPTYHRTNKFTESFQNIVDAYGVATYREVNPGLATIVTFPFMFAIMFGDLGHGFIVTLAALTLVYYEKPIGAMKRDEIFDMAFSGRYVLLLMGLFSMYTGTLYNDLFSKSMTLFESAWVWPRHFREGDTVVAAQHGTYSFGLDLAWHGTENALLFTNSYKMKLAILMGYIHMSYSYFFSLVNYVNFKSVIDIVGNFVPGFLFLHCIFGYLSLCVVYKWTVDWYAVEQQPPGLLNMLISMFLSPGTVAEPLYPGQAMVQLGLLAIALACVPCLLLIKPLYFKRKLDREAKEAQYHQLGDESGPEEPQDDDDDDHEEHNFGDIMIHQVIHTIEFCLNCVLHTASYLRLWALSLAHAQLLTVLWSMTMANAFTATGVVGVALVFFLFAMWFVLTVVILVLMEGTSAMLHSLRLHWVEAMSKFFVGGGHAYEPFGFRGLLDDVL